MFVSIRRGKDRLYSWVHGALDNVSEINVSSESVVRCEHLESELTVLLLARRDGLSRPSMLIYLLSRGIKSKLPGNCARHTVHRSLRKTRVSSSLPRPSFPPFSFVSRLVLTKLGSRSFFHLLSLSLFLSSSLLPRTFRDAVDIKYLHVRYWWMYPIWDTKELKID